MQPASPRKPAKKKSEPVRPQAPAAPVSQVQERKEQGGPRPISAKSEPKASVAVEQSKSDVSKDEKKPTEDEAPAKTNSGTTRKFFPRSEEFEKAKQSIPAETHKRLSDLLRADFKYLEEIGE
ncbi:hypothetical protein [Rubellicoccus peritrichatus]|uniref:Uncharacterized protein n=1 Tax=Rubellicoccus peritrichatus TaxID=3080537 RepID=A0AAQ3QTY7_9BACT|nr:hypothetical protein [Puniceicoccus sp. CR14]WOO39435.1 hypothetical protein RZN69_12495 [Puniceicoccus sp. CR14]